MRTLWLVSLALSSSAAGACKKDYGVGDPCIPDSIPCDDQGENCGFHVEEVVVQTDAPACEARACVVHRLDNGTRGAIPADPRFVCDLESNEGCVPRASLESSVHCTCRCAGPKGGAADCECPEGFVCKQLVTEGDPAFRGGYCVVPR